MYQILCGDFPLYDPRVPELILLNPKCTLEVNTVCGGSFTILKNHPNFGQLKALRSIFEIRQDGHPIFRGRMTKNSRDFQNKFYVDLEGVLAFTNDTVIEPFRFPDDFPEATQSGNMVEYFFRWVLQCHNEQVKEDWQRLKAGTVTVSDPNNYIARESTDYASAWETLKTKLVDLLGGYLVIRYEDDGNYVDYVSSFDLTNPQPINFGENMIDMNTETDATSTYSVILPLGSSGNNDQRLTLEGLADGDLTEDLVKQGKFIYSKSKVAEYGWICMPTADSTWDDVTVADNLQTKAMEKLTGAISFTNTSTIRAVDLGFTDEQIQKFRIYRNVLVNSPVHGIENGIMPLTKLEIYILNPQNTLITVGEAIKTLVDISKLQQASTQSKVEGIKYDIQSSSQAITESVKEQTLSQMTQVINDCNAIILAALESYVETSNFEEYKETVATQLQILSDEILMNFTTTTEHIVNVDGDMQGRFTEIYKYISFKDGNITLGSGENAITLTLENDMILFKKNGLQFGWWDGVDFHTGNIVVEVNERAQFGNFAFVPRSDGSLMFLKVGG